MRLLRAPSGGVDFAFVTKGPTFGGPMLCMGGAEPGAERL